MEALMHFVWEFMLSADSLVTTGDSLPVTVIDPGRHNFDAGPDFFNAKVMIGDRLWAGDIEIHTRASDWTRHGHDNDPTYNSVILHVVAVDDRHIRRPDGSQVPQVVMACNSDFRNNYAALLSTAGNDLPCRGYLPSIHSLHVTSWIAALGFERLHEKANRILALLQQHHGDWQQALFITLARAFGFGLNSDPMQRLAEATPLQLLHKHADEPVAIEALLLGQGGLLDGIDPMQPYNALLLREYRFYSMKFNLRRLESPGWRLSRARPGSHPARRVATLAAMVTGGFTLMSDILDAADDVDRLRQAFDVTLSSYWSTHYLLDEGSVSASPIPALGRQSVVTLLINVVAPLLMAYGLTHNDTLLQDRAVSLLEKLPAESNRYVRTFIDAGIACPDAFTSQALLRLHHTYCTGRDCIRCRLGHRILSTSVTRRPTLVTPV